MVLLYSNRRLEDAAFIVELQSFDERSRSFRLVATTLVSASIQPWEGQTGLIDKALLKGVAVGLSEPIYYVAGPSSLVEAIRQTLNGAGIDDDDIRSEDFYGS